MRDFDRASSRRLVSSRTASFESLTDEGAFDEGTPTSKRRDSSWDSKWRQQVASNGTPPFVRRIGGSPGRLNNAKWEEKAGTGSPSPLTSRRRLFKSPSVERKVPPRTPPLPPSIPEALREASSNSSSSSSESNQRADSVSASPRTVRRKLVIRAAKTPSPLPKEWANSDTRIENEARNNYKSKQSYSEQKTSEEVGLKKESNESKEGESHHHSFRESASSSPPKHSGTFTAIPVMAVPEDEAASCHNSSVRVRSSPEKKKFLNSMLNHSQEECTSSKYKSLGEVRTEQRKEVSMTQWSKEETTFSTSSSLSYKEKNHQELTDPQEHSSTEVKKEYTSSSPKNKHQELTNPREHSSTEVKSKYTSSTSKNNHQELTDPREHPTSEVKNEYISSTSKNNHQELTNVREHSSTEVKSKYTSSSSKNNYQELIDPQEHSLSEIKKNYTSSSSSKNNHQELTNPRERTTSEFKNEYTSSTSKKSYQELADPRERSSTEDNSKYTSSNATSQRIPIIKTSSKDQNNNDIPMSSPKKSPSPSEHVLTSLEKLVKETENMINKHLDSDEGDSIPRPSEAPPPPPPRSASINKVPIPSESGSYSIPQAPPPPPPPVLSNNNKKKQSIPPRLLREASPSSTISEEVLHTARGLQNFEQNEEELIKAEKILEQRRYSNEERLLKKRLHDQKIQKEEMFRHKKEKEKFGPPPPPEDNETLESLIFQGSPPRPIRHTPTPMDPSTVDFGRPTMVKTRQRDDVSSLNDEIMSVRSNSLQRMRALRDVEKRDSERMKEIRRSMLEENDDSFFPPPPAFVEAAPAPAEEQPHFVVLTDPAILPNLCHEEEQEEEELLKAEEDELLKAEEKELEALRNAGQRERELLEEMERRKREIEEEIARERLRIEELHRIENEKRLKFLNMKKSSNTQRRPKAVQQYEDMVSRKMNADTPSPPPPPGGSIRGTTPSGLAAAALSESSEVDEETDTEGYGDEDFSLGMEIPYSSNNATPTPTTGEMAELTEENTLPPPPLPPLGSLRSLLRSHGGSPSYLSQGEDASRKVHFSEIDQIKVLSMESLLSTINSEASEPIYSNVVPAQPSVRVESAFNQSRNYFQVRPPQRNQVV